MAAIPGDRARHARPVFGGYAGKQADRAVIIVAQLPQ